MSKINRNVPGYQSNDDSQPLRDNFAAAADEIDALQASKQDNLVSGVNVKTINGESILGDGNIAVAGGGAVFSVNGQTGAVDLNAADVGADAAGTAASAVAAHVAALDPHSQYTTASEAAAAAPVQTVAGRTGNVALTKSDVGLANVDNTSDANKPISTATQTALNGKLDTSHAGTGGAAHANATTTVAGFMSAGDKTKIDGVASGATANASDSALRDRSTHTGTQPASTINDFNTAADARIAAASINALADVVVASPSTGQVLKFNGTNWVNDTDATGGGGVSDGDKGDIVVSGGGSAWTVDSDAITNAKLANVATATIKGRTTAGSGDPEDLTAAQARTLLNVADGATANSADAVLLARGNHTGTQAAATISDFATAVSLNAAVAANTAKVTNATHTGDVTGATALTIADNAVTNAKAADMAANTVKARAANTIGDPSDVAIGASELFGRGSTGDIAPISLGTNLSMSGTTLNAAGGGGVTVNTYIGAGTYVYTVPAGAKYLEFDLTAAGGGGGSGRKGAAALVRCGGGGGGPGARSIFIVPVSAVGATVTITIGAVGSGGPAQATNSTNGVNGVAGGNITAVSSGLTLAAALGGNAGSGGTGSAGAGGAARTGYWNIVSAATVAGAAASTTGAAGTNGAASLILLPTGGGAGGGITSANVASAGGIGGGINPSSLGTMINGGASGAIATNGSTGNAVGAESPGTGGGGGGSSLVGNAGEGGNGGNYGAGGGGGGAAVDGVGNSGKGGNGGPGIAIVRAVF
jgi:hypothetical protein